MGQNMFDNGKGKVGSIRVILAISYLTLIYLIVLWRKIALIEIEYNPTDINYNGLSLLFGAMVANVGVILVAKVLEKKFEK